MAWTLKGSILGPQGDAGTRGPKGDTGDAGRSPVVTASPTQPNNPQVGDIWFNSSTKALLVFNASSSWSGASLEGPKGDQGLPGTPGEDGENISVWTGTAAQYASVDKNAYDLYLVKQ